MTTRDAIVPIADKLPVAIYLVANDGRFLYANERLRKLLHLPAGDITRLNIADFYANRADRDRLVEKVRRTGELVKEPATFVAGRRTIQVQMSCNPVRENDAFLGYLGVLVEVTEESEYHSVFDAHVRAGVYRVDDKECLTQANLAFAKIHGYDSVEEIRGKPVTELYQNPADAHQIKRQIVAEKEITRKKIALKGRDGRIFSAWVTAVGFFDLNGQYAGRAGIIEDRSQEEQYERFLDDIPVGFYMIENRKGKDEVVACNQEFAKIFEVPSRNEMIGRDVTEFHDSPDDTARLMEKIEEAARNKTTLLGEQFNIRTALKNKKTIEVNARPHVVDGRVVGRTGAIRDITKEVEMRDRITTLTNDIGAILHTFRHILTQLEHNMAGVSDVLAGAPDTPRTVQTPDELESQVRAPLNELTTAVDSLLATIGTVTHAEALDRLGQEDLKRIASVLRDYQSKEKPHWRDLWREGAVEILAICKRIRPKTIAREAYRPVMAAAEKVASITGLATLSVAREAIAAVEAPIETLHEFVLSGTRPNERVEVLPIESCVVEAINSLADFADERRVRIQFDAGPRCEVLLNRHEITRAIRNLLHNAIKYSWRREDGRTWVSVSVSIRDRAKAVVSVENWGVPVPLEERDLVFQLGFRGRFSSDRGRVGTGVGLTDSLRIAKSHGGTVRIESRPASQHANPKSYDQPFVTVISLELPLARK